MLKKILLGFLLILVIALAWMHDLVWYGIQQGKGQLKIVMEARDVEEILQDPSSPDSLKAKLRYVAEVREYAISSLGLNDTENYTSLYDQKGEPILWVVTGTRPFAFDPYEWKFPVVGTVPYKGFFTYEYALEERERIKARGFDAGIRTVGGWSTLGWFRDPILSNMLFRSNGDLANLIIHELVHATIFVKDSVNFNENLASFIGDRGAAMFLSDRYGEDSQELQNYLTEIEEEKAYAAHILRGADQLGTLYASMKGQDSLKISAAKRRLIDEIVDAMDTLSFSQIKQVQQRLKEVEINNTYFMSFIRYRERQGDLDSLFTEVYGGDLQRMISELRKTYPYL